MHETLSPATNQTLAATLGAVDPAHRLATEPTRLLRGEVLGRPIVLRERPERDDDWDDDGDDGDDAPVAGRGRRS